MTLLNKLHGIHYCTHIQITHAYRHVPQQCVIPTLVRAATYVGPTHTTYPLMFHGSVDCIQHRTYTYQNIHAHTHTYIPTRMFHGSVDCIQHRTYTCQNTVTHTHTHIPTLMSQGSVDCIHHKTYTYQNTHTPHACPTAVRAAWEHCTLHSLNC